MADFLVCPGHRHFRGGDAGADLGTGESTTVTNGLLLALSVAVFIYLGFALFKAERF
jgi:K+-transporting ATPase KdpF subunit